MATPAAHTALAMKAAPGLAASTAKAKASASASAGLEYSAALQIDPAQADCRWPGATPARCAIAPHAAMHTPSIRAPNSARLRQTAPNLP